MIKMSAKVINYNIQYPKTLKIIIKPNHFDYDSEQYD